LYEYARIKGLIGPYLEGEEKYLLHVSDRDAADDATTLNFTNAPMLVHLSWRYLILAVLYYQYLKKFGHDHYKKVVFTGSARPGFMEAIIKRKAHELINIYPVFFYRVRFCLWILTLLVLLKRIGPKGTLRELGKLIGYGIRKVFGLQRRFEYKPLRAILDGQLNVYSGCEEMVALRKGR
jgi:hypothetical protein|tara:strand:- start:2091 stop:2630 length:540 start_codon:yes stop_codon:yes gene_type:complete